MRRIAVVSNYSELIACLRQRAETLNISNVVLDDVSGLQDGYSGKLLSLNPKRTLGRLSLGLMLGALGLRLIVVEDREALKRVKGRLEPRKRNGLHRQLRPAGGQQ
jgi:hypothetical protein